METLLKSRRELRYRGRKYWRAVLTLFCLFLPPDASRIVVYYDENDESAIDIAYEAVDLEHFDEEDSFSRQDGETLRSLIEDALPLLDSSTVDFASAVYAALLTFDDHASFKNEIILEYERLRDLERCVPSFGVYHPHFCTESTIFGRT